MAFSALGASLSILKNEGSRKVAFKSNLVLSRRTRLGGPGIAVLVDFRDDERLLDFEGGDVAVNIVDIFVMPAQDAALSEALVAELAPVGP